MKLPMKTETLHSQLSKRFDPKDIEWRVLQSRAKGDSAWAIIAPYLQARAAQERLDESVGTLGWKNEIKPLEGGFLHGVSLYDTEKANWITKWDGAECTQIEALKGGISDSFKRACVLWGIGRYLYTLEGGPFFADIFPNKAPGLKYQAKSQNAPAFYWKPGRDAIKSISLNPESAVLSDAANSGDVADERRGTKKKQSPEPRAVKAGAQEELGKIKKLIASYTSIEDLAQYTVSLVNGTGGNPVTLSSRRKLHWEKTIDVNEPGKKAGILSSLDLVRLELIKEYLSCLETNEDVSQHG